MSEFHATGSIDLPADVALPEAFAASPEELALFFRGYVECMLWANVEWGTESGDPPEGYDAGTLILTEENLRELAADVIDFIDDNYTDLTGYVIHRGMREQGWASAGCDFALTRNGHGTGFWDRGLGERGDRLAEASRPYGTQSIAVEIIDGEVSTYVE